MVAVMWAALLLLPVFANPFATDSTGGVFWSTHQSNVVILPSTSDTRNLEPSYACNQIIASYKLSDVTSLFETMVYGLITDLQINQLAKFVLSPGIKYGVELRKVCGSCIDFRSEYGGMQGFGKYCGDGVYGSDATHSGLLLIPLLDVGGELQPRPGTLKGYVHGRPLAWDTDPTPPSCQWHSGREYTPSLLFGLVSAAVGGSVAILPDYMGYGDSEDLMKGYLIKKSYQTSTIPLWLNAQRILGRESNCKTALGSAAGLGGYGEGGYASIAVAEALSDLGVNVVAVHTGAAPLKLGSFLLPTLAYAVDEGHFPMSQHYQLALLGGSFSGAHPGATNYQQGSSILSANYQSDILDALQTSDSGAVDLVIPYDNPLAIFHQDVLDWARDARGNTNWTPCTNTPLPTGIDPLLCQTLAENDLESSLSTVSYKIKLCHSQDDSVVDIANLADLSANPQYLSFIPSKGNHSMAMMDCLVQNMVFLTSREYENWEVTKSHEEEDGCPTTPSPTDIPTGPPTSGATVPPKASPTDVPTNFPLYRPTVPPTLSPSEPSDLPRWYPTTQPSAVPNSVPTTLVPTEMPTSGPTGSPNDLPKSAGPTKMPASEPSGVPTVQPMIYPVAELTLKPTTEPSFAPKLSPSPYPTSEPTSTSITTSDNNGAKQGGESFRERMFRSSSPQRLKCLANLTATALSILLLVAVGL